MQKKWFLDALIVIAAYITTINYLDARSYKYQLSVTAMFQNEGTLLKEWIEFHLLVGVEHFYLYNNLSNDNYKKILNPYIKTGIVTLINWPYKIKNWMPLQLKANRDCLQRFGSETKWLAIIDLDEFLVPVKENNVPNVLSRFKKIGGIGVNWVMFGTSNVFKIPHNQLFIETLRMRSDDNFYENTHIKSIVRPKYVKELNSLHFPQYKHGFYNISTNGANIEGAFSKAPILDELKLHHYWTRNEDYFINHKLPRRAKLGDNPQVWIAHAAKYYCSIVDNAMNKYIPTLRNRMGLSD